MTDILNIIGGGMAGSEAAWQAANAGVKVVIHEMRPKVKTFAHRTEFLGEMVCSNSFRSDDDEQNAVGLLHWEMRAANGLIMATAEKHRIPAGGALAVDRDPFAQSVTAALTAHPNISISYEEITSLPETGQWIIATGPLTSGGLAEAIAAETGVEAPAFFDAIAPIVYHDSINMDIAWMQSRYDKGETEEEQTAYLNCPMNKDQYEAFIDALLDAEKADFKDGETAGYFDGCLPIEVMAERGRETLRFGPMKPVGLTNPHHPEVKPYAVVQLRRFLAWSTCLATCSIWLPAKNIPKWACMALRSGWGQLSVLWLGKCSASGWMRPRLTQARLIYLPMLTLRRFQMRSWILTHRVQSGGSARPDM